MYNSNNKFKKNNNAYQKNLEEERKNFRKNHLAMQQMNEELEEDEEELNEQADDVEDNDSYAEEETLDDSSVEDSNYQSNNADSVDDNSKNKKGKKTKKLTKNKKTNVVAKTTKTAKNVKAKVSAARVTLRAFLSKYGIIIIIALIILFILALAILMELGMFAGKGSSGSSGGTSQSYSSAWDAMSLNKTVLTKTEFVDRVNTYYSASSSSSSSVFSDNAEAIYDIATSNNINPELVVVRAQREGYSPGGSTNNYWGIGCTNTGGVDACHTYSSFSEGVLAFVENAAQYDSLSSMMSKYAYIGSYWYNPGGSGIGGCYYYPYIKDYLTPTRSAEVAEACSGDPCNSAGGKSCVATTDEDQLAYSKWQVANMADSRQAIFGIAPDVCDSCTSGCTIYAQGDSNWKNINLGKSDATMGSEGCAVTSIAIGISCSGTTIHIDNFNAGTFVEELNDGNCFTSGGAIYWGCSKLSSIADIQFVTTQSLKGKTDEEKTSLINSYDSSNHFIVLGFKNSKHPRGHYVVYTSTSGSNYITKDPAGGVISTIPISDFNQIVVYKF